MPAIVKHQVTTGFAKIVNCPKVTPASSRTVSAPAMKSSLPVRSRNIPRTAVHPTTHTPGRIPPRTTAIYNNAASTTKAIPKCIIGAYLPNKTPQRVFVKRPSPKSSMAGRASRIPAASRVGAIRTVPRQIHSLSSFSASPASSPSASPVQLRARTKVQRMGKAVPSMFIRNNSTAAVTSTVRSCLPTKVKLNIAPPEPETVRMKDAIEPAVPPSPAHSETSQSSSGTLCGTQKSRGFVSRDKSHLDTRPVEEDSCSKAGECCQTYHRAGFL